MVGGEMMFFRPMLYARSATLVGLVIGCLVAVDATSAQELSVGEQSMPAPAVGPRNLVGPVADSVQKSVFPMAATLPVDGSTLQALTESINPLWVVPIASFSAIRDRPIFSPSRRPAVNANPSSVQPGPLTLASQRPPFSLIGAVAGETDGIGIFLEEATKNIVRLKTQESHAGWTLTLVKGREATLQRGGEIAVLDIPNP
jgi:hypothetical protein